MTEIWTLKQRQAERLARMRVAVASLEQTLTTYARGHSGRFVIYGSIARGQMRTDSDIDIMVDFPIPGDVDAYAFAEQACHDHALSPDVRDRAWCSDRLRARIAQEGKVLA
jgi:predicted nucleotidyltransferase